MFVYKVGKMWDRNINSLMKEMYIIIYLSIIICFVQFLCINSHSTGVFSPNEH